MFSYVGRANLYIRNTLLHRPGGRQKKSRAALEGGYRQARLNNEIVTRCNALINLVYAAYGRFLRREHVL